MEWAWVTLGGLVWASLIALAHWVTMPRVSIRGDDVVVAGAVRLTQLYVRLVHKLCVEGLENVPSRTTDEPLIVVANHTAGIDPLLIQSALPFEVRWMMGRDMATPILDAFWEFGRVILVDRMSGFDAASLRSALRHLQHGGVLGLFPEGHLERPARHILPFMPGVGLLVKKSRARVLPVVITGTPTVDPAWASLWRSSRSVIRFLPPIDYADEALSTDDIASDLRRRFLDATGWPPSEIVPKKVGDRWVFPAPINPHDQTLPATL